MDFSWITDPEQREKAEADYKASLEEAINAEVSGLKSNNEKLLNEKKIIAQKLEETNTSLDGVDIEKAKEMMALLEKNKKKDLFENGKLDEYVMAEVQTKEREIKAEFTSQIEIANENIDKITLVAEKYEGLYKNKIIEDAIRTVAMKSGCIANEAVIQDIIMRGKNDFNLNAEESGIEAKNPDGTMKKNINGDQLLTPDVWMDDLKKVCPHYFPASIGTNANGGSSGSRTSAVKNIDAKIVEAAKKGDMALYRELTDKKSKM